ncbi:MAG: GNAT family N-acetyltransferase [Pirellulaceae bacterium]|jgi:predicted acetyltransferase|nr:GNAT family N-acetyltransferase [Pirellulaceae bacterium]MDP7015672.1 GNAT family N-acetyltransferase [Pirellulaceae bacterium]
MQVDFHIASPEERLAAFENVHEFWGNGRTLAEHIAWRLASPQHQRASWCVGVVDGRVAASLGSYPMQYRVAGEVVRGIAIGAVHTLPEFRGHGLAPRLMDWVEQDERSRGAAVSLLFSDIKPEYYARMGYQLCESWELDVDCGSAETSTAIAAGTWRLDELATDERQIVAILQDTRARQVANLTFSVERTDEYWQYLFRRHEDEHYFSVIDASGSSVGWACLGAHDQTAVVHDAAISTEIDPARFWCELTACALRFAQERGCAKLIGWIPHSHAGELPAHWLRRRREEITMIKPLDESVELTAEVRRDATHLTESEHV